MLPIEDLNHEHRIIERMLAILEAASDKAESGQELPAQFFPRAVDFIRNFADRCHHGKEEDNLFPAMEKRGIPRQGGPIGVMLTEHDQGRAYVRGIDEAGQRIAAGDKAALKKAAENARGYASLLRQHIDKEDNILYQMAEQVLSPVDQQDLMAKFEEVEMERIGEGKHEECVRLVEDLENGLGLR